MIYEFTLFGQPVTKKNSLRKYKSVVLPSRAFVEYEKACHLQISRLAIPHITEPLVMTVKYYLHNKRRPDLLGLLQATSDILQDEYKRVGGKRVCVKEWLYTDDALIYGYGDSRIVGIDRANPRAEIRICVLSGQICTKI